MVEDQRDAKEYNYTNENLAELIQVFNSLGKITGNSKFSYFVAKNKLMIEKALKEIQRLVDNISNEYLEYDKKRVAINIKYCEKDTNGNPVIKNNNYVIPADAQASFKDECKILGDENKTIVEAEVRRMADLEKLLKEPCGLALWEIDLSNIPKEVSGNELAKIMDLVRE